MAASETFAAPDRATLEREAARLVAHPEFSRAIVTFCDGLTGLHARVRVMRIGPADTQRWAIAALVIALDTWQPQGARAADVVRLVGYGGIAGASAARNTLTVLAGMGLIATERDPEDRRQLRLRPTERLFAVVHEGLAVRLGALECVWPLPAPASEWARRHDVALRYIVRNVSAYATARFKLTDGFPEVSALMDRQSGYLVLLEMLARAHVDGAVVRSQVSPSGGAARFDVSRTQVRKLLRVAEAQGWLQIEGHGGQVRIEATTYARLRHWIALELAWLARLVGEPVASAP